LCPLGLSAVIYVRIVEAVVNALVFPNCEPPGGLMLTCSSQKDLNFTTRPISDELLMSQVVQQEALTSLLIEKGIFTKEEFLGMVKVVDQEMKGKGKEKS
jgi:hypothetical protein